jgi:hypothetical protein
MLWAVYNAIPPVLFFVYFFTKGRLLKGLCSFAQVLGLVLAAGKRHFMCYVTCYVTCAAFKQHPCVRNIERRVWQFVQCS